MKLSVFWAILGCLFGAVWLFDGYLLIMGGSQNSLILANGARAMICLIQMERSRERERAAEAANREQTPNQG